MYVVHAAGGRQAARRRSGAGIDSTTTYVWIYLVRIHAVRAETGAIDSWGFGTPQGPAGKHHLG